MTDILIANGKIEKVGKDICPAGVEYDVIDAEGRMVLPGYVDQHVHIIGGGGESGFHSRTPEGVLSEIVSNGITTLVGVLGTDGTTRHPESLLAKTRALEEEGISTYMLIGSYEMPLVTITGDARNDIILIDKIIGIGEVAIADHRSSQITLDEFKRMATQARLGGMLSGKGGILQLHMGAGSSKLKMLFDTVEQTEIPIYQIVPTHINRNMELLEDGIKYGKKGGYIDITSSISIIPGVPSTAVKPSTAAKLALNGGVPADHITMSSDGYGSMPLFDSEGRLVGLDVGKQESMHAELMDMILKEGMDPSTAIAIITKNPACELSIYPKKGCVTKDSDADLLILDDYKINTVIAKGRVMMKDKKVIVKGTFEK